MEQTEGQTEVTEGHSDVTSKEAETDTTTERTVTETKLTTQTVNPKILKKDKVESSSNQIAVSFLLVLMALLLQ